MKLKRFGVKQLTDWIAGGVMALPAEPQGDQMRLLQVERNLIWIRRLSLAMWTVALIAERKLYFISFSLLLVVAGVAYMEGFHRHNPHSRDIVKFTRMTAFGDSLLAFTMVWTVGGAVSPFVPLFYFTIVAAAFRFGTRTAFAILLFNILLFLVVVAEEMSRGHWSADVPYTLLYMLMAFTLGAMLSNWAARNLQIAVDQAEELGRERDRSLSLLRRLIGAQEEERRLLSEDLHDRMGESLFSIGHGLDACIASAPSSTASQLVSLRQKLATCSSDMRHFMNELRPNVLDELGLCEAIIEYTASLRSVVPFEIHTAFDARLTGWRSRQDAMLFRLIQEAILNARKHSAARRVDIRLKRDRHGILLSIRDDGRGFDLKAIPAGHFGLMMMRERAEASGGKLKIECAPGKGTRITIRYEDEFDGANQDISD